MEEKIELKLRDSLNETSFRRYEAWIGDATKGSVKVDPMKLPKPKRQGSFATGIREAIRGYKRFNYNSKVIPFGYDVSRIKVLELADGNVMLRNEVQDRENTLKAKAGMMSLVVDVNGTVVMQNTKDKAPASTFRKMEEIDDNKYREWCEEFMQHPEWRYDVVWIVRAANQMEAEMLKETKKHYEGLDVEELDHGWWRLYR